MESQSTINIQKNLDDFEKDAYIYAVMPFHIIAATKGDLFDEITNQGYSQDELYTHTKELEYKIKPLSIDQGKLPGDLSKYYDFMQHHYGEMEDNKGISVFQLNGDLLKPSDKYIQFKNANAQLKSGARLGSSEIQSKIDTFSIIVNEFSGIGFFIIGLKCETNAEHSIVYELRSCEFFRNIGWRRKQKLNPSQRQKHEFIFDGDSKINMTFYDIIECYLTPFSEYMRFYQDRPTVLYCTSSMIAGNLSDTELCEMAYEIIRVPDKNAGRFTQSLTEPAIHRIGQNVVFTSLNEGALVIESANKSGSCKNIANKYFPAFFFALNQREVLLGTMQKIAILDAYKLRRLDTDVFVRMENLRNNLLVLQLKQIFYTVSNLHEIEFFFNELQKVFAVEKMLMENEQCIREMYNLLEFRRNEDIIRVEKESSEREEERSKIINTILGAIGCLGLFSFLKDLWPFIQDTQYASLYKFISVILPVLVMAWLVWYMAGKKHK